MTYADGNEIVLDCETTGLSTYEGHRPFKIGLENSDGDVSICKRNDFRHVKKIVEDKKTHKISHNTKFDMKMCTFEGMKPRGKWHDTMIMAHLIDEYVPNLKLEFLSEKYLGSSHEESKYLNTWMKKNTRGFKKDLGRKPRYSDFPPKLLDKYLEKDLDDCLGLFWLFDRPIYNSSMRDTYETELNLIPYVIDMENRGITVDMEFYRKLIQQTNQSEK